MTKNPDTLCITVDELGELLRVSRPTAYSLVHRDGFPVIRIGRRLLIIKSALEKWLENQVATTVA